MQNYRIRIRRTDGEILVIDKSHSQLCEYITGTDRIWFRRFLAKEAMNLPNGDNVKFMDYV
jgi:hypothetical protein